MATPYFFTMINPGTVVLGAFFLIFLALLSYILSKVFRDKYGNVNTATVGVISFCISVLIVYFGKDMVYNLVDGLRLSNTILYVLCGVAILVLLYLLRRRLRFCMILMIIGAGLILMGAFTDWFYQKWFVIVLGIILLLFGIWLCSKKKENYPLEETKDSDQQPTQNRNKRNVYDLKQKYMAYLFQYYNKGNTPQRKKRIKQAMMEIIKIANKMGYPPRVFLSRKIAGQNAKAPNQLK